MKFTNIILILLFSLQVSAQSFDKEKLDSLLNYAEKMDKAMGSLSIFKNGEEVYTHATGFAFIDKNQKSTKETRYRIGSISKTFTATVILQLVDEKKLELNTSLGRYFPEFKNADKITIEDLLRHRSGIFNITNTKEYETWMEKPISREELVNKMVKAGTSFEPREKVDYSNSNYILLTYIIEKIEGKDFADVIKKRITKPCQLKNTYYGSKINPVENEAYSYQRLADWKLSSETDMSVPAGAGAIVSTPKDLNIFINCLYSGKLLSDSIFNKMTSIEEGFGMGLIELPFYDLKAYGHTGGIDEFRSNAFIFPSENVSISYISNGLAMPMNDLMIGILSIYFGKDYNFPVFTESLVLTSEELDQYPGVYASPTFPLKITITNNDGVLTGQATGQSSFPMDAYEKDKFRFDPAKLTMEFFPEEGTMILRQGGGEFKLKRE